MLFIIFVTLIHEGLHVFALKCFLKKPYEMVLYKKYGIPTTWAIYSPYFDKPYSKMTKKVKDDYFLTALMPYLFLLPYFLIMLEFDIYQIKALGLIGIIVHLVNLPLEFAFVTKPKVEVRPV